MQFSSGFDRLSSVSSYSQSNMRGDAADHMGNDLFEPAPIYQGHQGINVVHMISHLPSSLTHNSEDYLALLSQLSQPDYPADHNREQCDPFSASARGQSAPDFDAFALDLEPAPIRLESNQMSTSLMDQSRSRVSGTPPMSSQLGGGDVRGSQQSHIFPGSSFLFNPSAGGGPGHSSSPQQQLQTAQYYHAQLKFGSPSMAVGPSMSSQSSIMHLMDDF